MSVPPQAETTTAVTLPLASWISTLRFEDLPAEVVAHLKLCLIDAVGCGLYGASQPWGRIAADTAAALSGGGGALLLGRSGTASPADAALANGTAIHGFEIDDIHVSSSLHPAAVTVPSALALAMAAGRDGRDLLTALAAGYEAGIRTGICAGLTHSTSGFHVTGTVGTVASSAAAAVVLALGPEATANALGIGATQAGGLYGARLGAMTKRLHAGRAAQSGVLAGLLAQRGFTGARDVIEAGFGGFMSAFHGQHRAETILEDLGRLWETLRVGFKAYAACASAHTTVDAVTALAAQGLTADNLDRMTVRLSKKGFTNVGWAYVPRDVVSAQMNGAYAAAVTLLDGMAFVEQYRPERIADPRTLQIIERIEMVHDPVLDAGGAAKRHAVRAMAQLKDGRRLETFVEQRTGSAERPLSRETIEGKFRLLASSVGASPQAMDGLVGAVDRLDEAASLTDLRAAIEGLGDPEPIPR